MRGDKLPLSTIRTLVITVLATLLGLYPPGTRRGRPRIYEDSLTLWPFQIRHRLSYREGAQYRPAAGISSAVFASLPLPRAWVGS
jgi:hypothetical protein